MNVVLVSNNDYLPEANNFFKTTVANVGTNLQLNPLTDSSRGCGSGINAGNGAELAVELYYRDGVTALFGPVCDDDLQITSGLSMVWDIVQFNFWRDYPLDVELNTMVQMSTASATNIASNIIAILAMLNWSKIGLVICESCYSNNDVSFDMIKHILRQRSIEILTEIQIDASMAGDVSRLSARLDSLEKTARIILPFFGPTLDNYGTYMSAFKNVTISAPEEYMNIITATQNTPSLNENWVNSDDANKRAFKNSIVLVNDYYNSTTLSRYVTVTSDLKKQVILAQLYESVFLYTNHLTGILTNTTNATLVANGTYVLGTTRNMQLAGPMGAIALDANNQRLVPFRVYAFTTMFSEFGRIMVSENCPHGVTSFAGKCTTLVGDLVDVNGDFVKTAPSEVPSCGLNGELCDQKGTIVIVVAVIAAVVIAVAVFLCARKMRSGETAAMPWAVNSNNIKLLNSNYQVGSNDFFQSQSIHSLQNEQAKVPVTTAESRTLLGTVNQVIVIVEVYQMREKLVFDKKDMQMLFHMKQCVHDNMNTFVGVTLSSPQDFYVIWKHCTRGSLADILFKGQDERKAVDQNFTGAFVRDIMRGLDFIHSSSVGYHGALTAYNCLIDSHWILKLSGFGTNRLLYKWRLAAMISGKDGGPIIPDDEIYYYAPDVRMRIGRAVSLNRAAELDMSEKEAQASDMFSFGVVLYELLYRKKAYDPRPQTTTKYAIDDGAVEGVDELHLGIASDEALQNCPPHPEIEKDSVEEVHPDLVQLLTRCFNGNWESRPDATMARKITDATLKMPGSLVDQMIKNMEQYNNNLENLVKMRTGQLEEAQKKSEEILLELLPKSVADTLKLGRVVPPKNYKMATIMYSDIVGFTSLCSESQPMEVVTLLSGVFKAFDSIINEHMAYKVETIGDAYMVASGVPEKIEKKHVKEISMVALKMREFLFDYTIPHRPGEHLHCRWGFNSGPVFTGVVGITAPRYCVFGSTVTIAAKMENSGQQDRIQMTIYSQKILADCFPEFHFTKRDAHVRINGLGNFLTYWLDGYEELLGSVRNDDDASSARP